MVTLDSSHVATAKEMGLNVSAIANSALYQKTIRKKKDLPEQALTMKCTECGKEIDYGFLCQELDKFYCQECQDKCNMRNHPHMNGEHQHIRIPGYSGQHTELLK